MHKAILRNQSELSLTENCRVIIIDWLDAKGFSGSDCQAAAVRAECPFEWFNDWIRHVYTRGKKAQQIGEVISVLGTDFLRMDQLSLVMSLPGKVLILHGVDAVHQERIASKFSFSIDGLKPNQGHLARYFLFIGIDRREYLIFTRKSAFCVLSAQEPTASV
jgi:hypothetical protein